MWNMVSLYISRHVKMTGELTAMEAERCAGIRQQKKRMPFCNGADTD